MALKSYLAGLLLAAPLGLAHPGHHEAVQAHRAQPLERRSLEHCSREFADPVFVKRSVERHVEEYARLRRAAGYEESSHEIHKRDYISVSRIDHKTNKPVSKNMDPSTLFADAGACILMPAVDQGPLYVRGEEIRKDITEGEAGVKMTLAVQVVNYQNCQVVPDVYVDIWSSNATGIYMGVQGYPGMGNPNDAGMLKGTAMRGVQPTDKNGVAVFDTLLPGHYDGRATHIHAIAYVGATRLPNNTISGGRASHIGQIYFDQTLLTQVRSVIPYNQNRMRVTQNTADMLFMAGANGDDPIVRYNLIGSTINDGVYAWIRFGINPTLNRPVSPAAFWTANGGVMNPSGPVAQMNRGGFGGGFPAPGRPGKRDAAREAEKAEKWAEEN